MRKVVLTFGLIAGAFLSVMMLLSTHFQERIGFDNAFFVGYTTMVLAFLMVYFGVRSYRDNVAGGRVTFGRAFSMGLLITVIASVCYVATWQLVYYKTAPDHMAKWSAYEVDKARKSGATEAEIAAKAKEMADLNEKLKNPLVNIAFTFLEPLPVGILMTLVTAGILSRKRKTPGAADTAVA